MQTNAWLAVLLGAGVAVVLFVPVVAWSYRRSGSYSLADLVRTLAVPVYVAALGTYTLLPLPDPGSYRCTSAQLNAFGFVGDIERQWHGSLGDLLRNPVFLQVALNILLFVPLGWFVRTVAGRGVVVATLVGAAVSLLIETTQVTGIWGIYPCSYRVFDVDDLIINTSGALIGSVISRVLVGRRRKVRPAPRHLTSGRRVVSLACDALVMVGLGAGAAVLWRGWSIYGIGRSAAQVDLDVQSWLQYAVPLLIQACFVLVAGRSVGEWVTEVDTRSSRVPLWVARPMKLMAGPGALTVLLAMSGDWTRPGLLVFALLTVSWAFVGDHRGLANTVAGLRVVIDEESPRGAEQPVGAEPGEPPPTK